MPSKVSFWIAAMRLRTLPLTAACIGLGAFLAAANHIFSLAIFLLCLLTAFSLQILSNLANDYGDSIHGADHAKREGPSREVQSGNITASQMKLGIKIFGAISLVSGVILLREANLGLTLYLVFLGLGILSIVAAVLYTNGKLPYGYIGLGDISVFIFFGLIGVAGSYFLYSGQMEWDILLPAASCGLLSVGVLNINNIRDIESDKAAGKYSIPVRLGRKKAIAYHILLLGTAVIMALIFVSLNYKTPFQYLFILTLPLLIINIRGVSRNKQAGQLDPYLRQMAITTLIFTVLLGISMLELPFL